MTVDENHARILTCGTKHNSSPINDKFCPGIINIATSADQEINVIPYNTEPGGAQSSGGAVPLYSTRSAPRIGALLICANPIIPLML